MPYLMNRIFDRGYDKVALECVVGNPARKLYDEFGFTPIYTERFVRKKLRKKDRSVLLGCGPLNLVQMFFYIGDCFLPVFTAKVMAAAAAVIADVAVVECKSCVGIFWVTDKTGNTAGFECRGGCNAGS